MKQFRCKKYLAKFRYTFVCYTCVNLRAKRDVDHAFKTKTKPKRANSTKTKHSMSLHGVKIIHAHIGHAKRVVACS